MPARLKRDPKIRRKPSPSAPCDPAIEMGRKLEAITAWQDALDHGPKFKGCVDLYAPTVEAIALKCDGYAAFSLVKRLAQAGHPKAIRDLVRWSCELAEALEDTAASHPDLLRELAEQRADWPVMLCRHETSAKPITFYLDRIGLGRRCVINADGTRIAKYSLRTPINRFVWRKLKRLPWSIGLMCDFPRIAAINLASLPRLTKATARLWADKALMPYFDALYDDYSRVPEFASILRRPGVRTRGQQRREIRKDVIRALQSLAPPA